MVVTLKERDEAFVWVAELLKRAKDECNYRVSGQALWAMAMFEWGKENKQGSQ